MVEAAGDPSNGLQALIRKAHGGIRKEDEVHAISTCIIIAGTNDLAVSSSPDEITEAGTSVLFSFSFLTTLPFHPRRTRSLKLVPQFLYEWHSHKHAMRRRADGKRHALPALLFHAALGWHALFFLRGYPLLFCVAILAISKKSKQKRNIRKSIKIKANKKPN